MTAFNFQLISFEIKFHKFKKFPIVTLKSINKFVSYNVKIINGYRALYLK
jgi:hypothetical protein